MHSFSLSDLSVWFFRQMYHASDGGTFALDWLLHSDGKEIILI